MRIHPWLPTLAAALAVGSASSAWAQARPRLEIAAPAVGCPAIGGAFVALLDADRGLLLLSAAPYEGAQRLGEAGGAALDVTAGAASWPLGRVAASPGPAPLWGNAYPFRGTPVDGCVAFEKERFSSEGDLVTYAQWLVDEVYLALPAAERERYPAFLLGEREVHLVVMVGARRLPLSGKEGATLAFRLTGEQRTLLLSPYIVDPAASRVAVKVMSTDQPMWQSAPKLELGWVMITAESPGRLEDPPIGIMLEGVR